MTEPASKQFSAEELAERSYWLILHPQFSEKPATVDEFLGPDYLNIAKGVRPGVRQALIDVFGEEVNPDHIAAVQKAMFTGAIGIGKSTFASIALPYMVHWVLCLYDPQEFFDLLPGSRIAFMMMSTSEQQARDVIFGDIDARIKYSPWFKKYPKDPAWKKQIKFPKDINILPGDSKETTFEGYNILGGVLEEMDSHTVTKDKDYADTGYDTIEGRMRSRFGKRGLVIAIGQMKKATGFAARKCAEFMTDPEAFVARLTLWASLGWDWIGDDPQNPYPFLNPDGSHKSFYYDYKRRMFIPKGVGDLLPDSNTLLEIPDYYRKDFQNRPEKSLKDLAGIPPTVTDPFISLIDKIELCRDRWIESTFPNEYAEITERNAWEETDISQFSPVNRSSLRPEFAQWFTNRDINDQRRRAAHVDMAYSGEGDAVGIAMGHVKGLTEDDEGEEQPIFKFDFLMRIKAPAGSEIFIPDIRKVIYYARDVLRFRLKKVTYDGFESQESIQQLQKKRFEVEKVSMDKSKLAYEDLREAIYGGRCEFPPYITEWTRGDADSYAEIAVKELSELHDDGRKIDHPPTGSKDLSDAMAGVVTELIGDRRYRRGVHSLGARRQENAEKTGTDDVLDSLFRQVQGSKGTFGSYGGQPLQPRVPNNADETGIIIPLHLRSKR